MIGEILVAGLIYLGAFFLFVGSFGLAKLPDLMRRLHGPTKATTLGIGALLIASMLFFILERGTLSIHELLITTFLFLTAPVTAHMVAKAHILRDKADRKTLPPTGRDVGWAVIDGPKPETSRSEPLPKRSA